MSNHSNITTSILVAGWVLSEYITGSYILSREIMCFDLSLSIRQQEFSPAFPFSHSLCLRSHDDYGDIQLFRRGFHRLTAIPGAHTYVIISPPYGTVFMARYRYALPPEYHALALQLLIGELVGRLLCYGS